jgi:hypothetical protein
VAAAYNMATTARIFFNMRYLLRNKKMVGTVATPLGRNQPHNGACG